MFASKTFLYLQLYIIPLTIATTEVHFSRFKKHHDLSDFKCRVEDTLFTTDNVQHVQACLSLCVPETTCYSVFYNEEYHLCEGCNATYSSSSPPTAALGYTHFSFYPVCPDTTWTNFHRSCYKLSASASFFDGADECESLGGNAVYIESADENEFLKTYVAADNTTWAHYIGITDCDVNSEWRYYGTNQLVEYLNFESSEGTEAGECCALFYDGYNGTWADFPCEHASFPFPTVCEINVDY